MTEDNIRRNRLANAWVKLAMLAGVVVFTLTTYSQIEDVRTNHLGSSNRHINYKPTRRNAAIAPSWVDGSMPGSMPANFDYCDDKSECQPRGPLKVIATSLYGGDPRYCHGTLRNSQIAKELFPDWQLWVYIPEPGGGPSQEVPKSVIDALSGNGAMVIQLDNTTTTAAGFGMNWRFLVADNKTVDRFIIRDGDSRLLLRDRYALDEWEDSGLPYHVARDHTSHSPYAISGGMWGGTSKAPTPNLFNALSALETKKKVDRVHDMDFLNTLLWPLMQKTGVRQHDAFSCRGFAVNTTGNITSWPFRRGGGEHVGAVYLTGDVSRPGDLSLLPSVDACPSPPYPPGDRTELRLSSGAGPSGAACDAPTCSRVQPIGTVAPDTPPAVVASGSLVQPLFSAYELRYTFVDAAEACPPPTAANGTALAPPPSQLPIMFNYTRMMRFPAQRYRCQAPESGRIQQYDGRMRHPRTHYDVFKPDGMQYFRLLFVVDVLYTDDPRQMLSEGLAALAYVLPRMPPYARLLLRDSPATDSLMAAAGRLGLAVWQGETMSNATLKEWRSQKWAAVHHVAPALWWAYRLIVITLEVPPLGALPAVGVGAAHFVDARATAVAAHADAGFAAVAYQLVGASAQQSLSCTLAVLGDGAKLQLATLGDVVLPTGWHMVAVEDVGSGDEYVDLLQRAAAVIVQADAPPLYLGLGRSGATLVLLHSSTPSPAYPYFCSLGIVKCVAVRSGPLTAAASKAQIEEALSDVRCNMI